MARPEIHRPKSLDPWAQMLKTYTKTTGIKVPTGIKVFSGKQTSARVNFGTRTSAQISKIFINFGTM